MYLKTKFGLFEYFIVLINLRLGLDCLIGQFDLQILLGQVFIILLYFYFIIQHESQDDMLLY